MRDPRTWSTIALVFVALVLQVTVVARLPLPGGVTPDLVLVVVAVLALRLGPLYGCVTGFCAGLIADVIPPAYHTIGRWALVYCLVGYLVGLATAEIGETPLLAVGMVAAGAIGGLLLYIGFGALLDDPRMTGGVLTRALPVAALYDVVLSPLVLYVVTKVTNRMSPEQSGWGRRMYGRPL